MYKVYFCVFNITGNLVKIFYTSFIYNLRLLFFLFCVPSSGKLGKFVFIIFSEISSIINTIYWSIFPFFEVKMKFYFDIKAML